MVIVILAHAHSLSLPPLYNLQRPRAQAKSFNAARLAKRRAWAAWMRRRRCLEPWPHRCSSQQRRGRG